MEYHEGPGYAGPLVSVRAALTNTSKDALATHIRSLAAGVLQEVGAEIYDLEVRPGENGLIRMLVDRAEGGITISEVTRIAKEVGYLLDAEDVVNFTYQWEVSSPGIERPVRNADTARRNLGKQVRLVLNVDLPDGSRVLHGELTDVTDDVLSVVSAAGETHRVHADDIRKGRTVFDFDSNKQTKK